MAYILLYTNGICMDFWRRKRFFKVYAYIMGFRIVIRHLPKRIFDDARGVVSDADLPKENVHAIVAAQKIRIPAGGFPPAFVFGKTVVRTQVHRHGLSAFRAPRDQRGCACFFVLPPCAG